MKYKLTPLARLVGYGVAGCEPTIMGIGPVPAISKSMFCFLFEPGLRIRIPIGSGFNQVSGSGFEIRIRIQEGKNYPQK